MSEVIKLREDWLLQATSLLSPLFESVVDAEQFAKLPDTRVTCGWPSHGGRSGKRKVLGECWDGAVATDGNAQIFITPLYSKNNDVLPVLLHELAHVVAGGSKVSHTGPFVKIVRAVGLEGKPTSTTAGPELLVRLNTMVTDIIGDYPHASLVVPANDSKQTTRMLKAKCPVCDCVYRITRKWLEEAGGTLVCPMPDCGEDVEID